MRAVILAGGLGTRLSEETHLRPKPMVEIGGKPILWHILKIYSSFGINEFVICLGYKGYLIKEYFANYFLHMSDVTFDFNNNNYMDVHSQNHEPWKVSLIDTGENTETAGRLLRVKEFIGDETFCFTYGDGLSNINIRELIDFHKNEQKKSTLTAVQPPGRYGALKIKGNIVEEFQEKPSGDNAWINGGFFVLEPSVLDFITGDECSWEQDVLPKLALEKQLSSFFHKGFWRPMDTLRDKNYLEKLWQSTNAPWKLW